MEPTEATQNEISVPQHALKWGLIIGVFGILFGIIIYIIDVSMLGSMKVGIGMMIFSIALVIYAGIQCRKDLGGFMSYKDGWIHGFITLAIAGLLSTLFQILLFNVIDTEAVEIVVREVVGNAEEMMEKFGMPEDQMGEALDKTESDTFDRFKPVGALMGYMWALIVYAILALIAGAISMKKNKDELAM